MQESGVPNVTGQYDMAGTGSRITGGAFREIRGTLGYVHNPYNGTYNAPTYFEAHRCSFEYQNNLNEVRVKSIISNGYIRLY